MGPQTNGAQIRRGAPYQQGVVDLGVVGVVLDNGPGVVDPAGASFDKGGKGRGGARIEPQCAGRFVPPDKPGDLNRHFGRGTGDHGTGGTGAAGGSVTGGQGDADGERHGNPDLKHAGWDRQCPRSPRSRRSRQSGQGGAVAADVQRVSGPAGHAGPRVVQSGVDCASRNVPEMFQKCSRNVPDMFQTCSRNVQEMFKKCSRNVQDRQTQTREW